MHSSAIASPVPSVGFRSSLDLLSGSDYCPATTERNESKTAGESTAATATDATAEPSEPNRVIAAEGKTHVHLMPTMMMGTHAVNGATVATLGYSKDGCRPRDGDDWTGLYDGTPPALAPPALAVVGRPQTNLPPLHNLLHPSRPPIVLPVPQLAQPHTFNMSTNPPNVRASFRSGDWFCPAPGCGEHNFGRNISCRTCAFPRPASFSPTAPIMPPHATSPRFQQTQPPHSMQSLVAGLSSMNLAGSHSPGSASSNGTASPVFPITPEQACAHLHPSLGAPKHPAHMHPVPALPSYGPVQPFVPQRHAAPPRQPPQRRPTELPSAAAPALPNILTPSGHAFAQGGRVQNISSDPSVECVLFWPDNEPYPDQGQLRPYSVTNAVHPPILNTGNRGPIEHQPGDWVCKKCSYLNWRRRKLCQACYPYADGNNDSISQAVQASRVAILKQLLYSQQQQQHPLDTPVDARYMPLSHQRADIQRSQMGDRFRSMPPRCDAGPRGIANFGPVGGALAFGVDDGAPIYQTSPFRLIPHNPQQRQLPPGHQPRLAPPAPFVVADDRLRQAVPTRLSSASLSGDRPPEFFNTFGSPTPVPATNMLLPSYLNELVQTPSLSPVSSAPSSLEFDGAEPQTSPELPCVPLAHARHSPKTATTGVPVARTSPTTNTWRADSTEARAFGPIGSGRKNSWDA